MASRMDFPDSLNIVESKPFLSHRSLLCLVAADSFLKEDDPEDIARVCRLAEPEELLQLAARWDRFGLVMLFC